MLASVWGQFQNKPIDPLTEKNHQINLELNLLWGTKLIEAKSCPQPNLTQG